MEIKGAGGVWYAWIDIGKLKMMIIWSVPRSELIGAHYSNVYLCVFAHKKKIRVRVCTREATYTKTHSSPDGGCANLCVIINQGMLVYRRRGAKKLFNSIISLRGASLCVSCVSWRGWKNTAITLHVGFIVVSRGRYSMILIQWENRCSLRRHTFVAVRQSKWWIVVLSTSKSWQEWKSAVQQDWDVLRADTIVIELPGGKILFEAELIFF